MCYWFLRYILHFNEVTSKIRILLSVRRWGPLANQNPSRCAEIYIHNTYINYITVLRSTSRAASRGFCFLLAGHWTKGFYQISIIIRIYSPEDQIVMAKYYISFDSRPSAIEFSTRHLVLCNCIYLSGCSQCEQVGTGQNWFLTHVK